MARSVSLSIALAIALAGCGGSSRSSQGPAKPKHEPLPPLQNEVVAQVGDYDITSHQIVARARAAGAAGGRVQTQDVLDALIDEAVIAIEAKRTGQDQDPRVVAIAEAARARAAAELLLAAVGAEVEVAEDMIQDAFHSIADWVHLEGVIVASEDQAKEVQGKLAAGAELADVAMQSLDQKSARAGGDLGSLTRGQLDPALAEVAFAGAVGQWLGPVEVANGWAVVRVGDRKVGTAEELAERRESITAFVEKQLAGEMKSHYVMQLRKDAGVEIDDAFLNETGTSLSATEEELDHPIATLYGEPVLYRDVLDRVRKLARGREGSHSSGASVKRSLATEVIDDRLLARAALARGLGDAPEAEAAAVRAERNALITIAIEQLHATIGTPTDDEIAAYYDDHPEEFTLSARRSCWHILVARESEAKELRERIRAGEDFHELAREFSLDARSGLDGGKLGPVTDAQLDQFAAQGEPALAETIRKTGPDTVSGPVKSRAGWHLIYVQDYAPERVAPLRKVRELIAATLVARRKHEVVRKRAEALRAGATIDVDRDALARVTRHVEQPRPAAAGEGHP